MHRAAYEGFRRMIAVTRRAYAPLGRESHALDLGGANVNGTVYDLLPIGTSIDVLDRRPGPGVTIVADAATWRTDDRYDLVLTTELLEHAENWRAVVDTAASALRDGGWFVGTCASVDRAPHGARGDELAPDEHYGNVDPTSLVDALREDFEHVVVEYRRDARELTTCDLYWCAVRRSRVGGST